MNPSKDTKDTSSASSSSFNLLTYFKWRRRDTESAGGDSSATSNVGSVSGDKKNLEERKVATITEIPLNREPQGIKPFELSICDSNKQPQGEMSIAQEALCTHSTSSHSPESAFLHARRLGEKIMNRIIIPDIMPNDCENIQTRSRYKTCITAINRGVQRPAREKRNTAIQSMIDNLQASSNSEFIQVKPFEGQTCDIEKGHRRGQSEIIGISQEINEYLKKSIKRASSADSFISSKQIQKKQVKISHWGVLLEGKLAAARRGFSSAAISTNAQAEMMTKFKETSTKIIHPDNKLKTQCQLDIFRLFRHRESLRRIAGDSLKHDGNRVQFKECCLSGKCQGIHVNPFKSMSDQQFLCRGFQAEEIYAKILINSHDLLINSPQLLNSFIQFAFLNERYSFNRLYKALEFVLCWIKYRSRTFQTHPAMLGRLQAFLEVLSMKYPPKNESSIPLNRCCSLSKAPQTHNEVICRCKEFLFGSKQLQERPRINSKPNSFLDASQDSTSVVQQCPIANHQQKKRGPPAAAVRALAPSNTITKTDVSNNAIKPTHLAKKPSIEGLSSLMEQPNLSRHAQSEQKQNKSSSEQHIITSENSTGKNQIIPGNSQSAGNPIRKASTAGVSVHHADFNNPQFSSVSASSQNYRTSLFVAGNSHFTNQISTRDSIADMIIITPAASQPSSKKSKLGGGATPVTISATANSGDCCGKSILSDRVLPDNNEYLSPNRKITSSQHEYQQYPRTRGQTIQDSLPLIQCPDDKAAARRYTEFITPIQEEWQTTQKEESFLEEHEIYEFNLEKQTIKEEQLESSCESDWKIRQHQQKLMVSSGLRTSEEISQSNIQDQIIKEQFIEQQSELLEKMQGNEEAQEAQGDSMIDGTATEANRLKVILENRTFSRVGMDFQGELLRNNNEDSIYTNCSRYNNTSTNVTYESSEQMKDTSDEATNAASFQYAKSQKHLRDELAKQQLLSCKIYEIQNELERISQPTNSPFCGCLDHILIEQLKSSWSVEGMLRSEERLNRSLENFKFSKDIFLVVDAAVLTQQLCLIDHGLFKDIEIQEFFSDKRLKALSIIKQFQSRTHLNALRERINVFTYYLVLLILVQNSDRERVNLLERILQISEWCIHYQNFCMTLSIYFLFNSTNLMLLLPPLLKKLQLHPQQQLKDLENTIQFTKSFSNLSSLMLNAQPPLVPALNILTRDMTLVDQQMSDYVILDDAQFLNLDKFELVAQTANVFYKAQSHDYPFIIRPSLYCFFKDQFKLFMGQYININDSKSIDAQLQLLAEQLISRKG